MSSARSFPWRWLIAGLAIAVVAVTLVVPPPGTGEEGQEPPSDTLPDVSGNEEDIPRIVPDTIRVLVLNGTSIDGLAGRTQRILLRSSSDSTVVLAPFDPSDTEHKPYNETVVISHLTDLSAAYTVSAILGLPESSVVWEVPASGGRPEVDVTVCLGQDLGADIPESERTE